MIGQLAQIWRHPIKGVGAEAPLNVEVVQAHLDSIVQLAELPNHQVELRQTVTQQLSVMVTKKLRQAGQAAADDLKRRMNDAGF